MDLDQASHAKSADAPPPALFDELGIADQAVPMDSGERRNDPGARAYSERATVVFRQQAVGALSAPILCCAIGYVLWQEVSHGALLAWAGLYAAVFVAILALVGAFFLGPGPASDWRGWEKLHFGLSVFEVMPLVVAAAYFYPQISAEARLFLAILLAGTSAGGLVLFVAFLSSALGFLVPMLVALSFGFYVSGHEFSGLLAALVWVYLGFLGYAGLEFNKTLRTSIELKYQNQALATELTDALEIAQTAEAELRAKSRFLSQTSHELRSPMNGIIGHNRLLLGSELDAAQSENSRAIATHASDMMRVIDNVLDFTKLSAGKIELQETPFDLGEIIAGTINMFKSLTDQKGVDLVVSVDSDIPDLVQGDPKRLKQILVNVVSNAVKFTSSGRIAISLVNDPTAGDRVCLSVSDTGIGIAPDLQEKLLGPYGDGQPNVRRAFSGNGLGVAICRELVDTMGGTFHIESTLGKGTTVTFSVPLRRVSTPSTVAFSKTYIEA